MTVLGQGTKSLLGFTLATSALPPSASQAWDTEGTWGGIRRYNSYVGILLALGTSVRCEDRSETFPHFTGHIYFGPNGILFPCAFFLLFYSCKLFASGKIK